MSYAELNESIIYDRRHNNTWRREQLSRVEGRRDSERAFDEDSRLSSNYALPLKETHKLEPNEERRDSDSRIQTQIYYAWKGCGQRGEAIAREAERLGGIARERRGLDDEPPQEAEQPHPRSTGILQDEGVEEWGAWCNWEADVVGDPER